MPHRLRAGVKKMAAQVQPRKPSRFAPHKQAGRAEYETQRDLSLSRRRDCRSAVRSRLFDNQSDYRSSGDFSRFRSSSISSPTGSKVDNPNGIYHSIVRPGCRLH
jgi:hypothetical protein